MYYFGIFSSHIPYILFTVVYMVYFGMNTLNKPKNGETLLASTENQIKETGDQNNELVAYPNCYVATSPDFYNSLLTDNNILPVIESDMLPDNFYPAIAIRALCFCFSVYTRPPPFIV